MAEIALEEFFNAIFKNFRKFKDGSRISIKDLRFGDKFRKLISYETYGKITYYDVSVVDVSEYRDNDGTLLEVKLSSKYLVDVRKDGDGEGRVSSSSMDMLAGNKYDDLILDENEFINEHWLFLRESTFIKIKDRLPDDICITDWLFESECQYIEVFK